MMDVLQTGCLFSGILCFLYFLFLMIYAGPFTSAAFIWILAGGYFLLCRFCLEKVRQAAGMGWKIGTGCLLLLLMIGIVTVVLFCKKIYAGGASKELSQSEAPEYVIVLGAHVRKTVPSRALERRLEKALEYAGQNPEVHFVLSGGMGFGEEITEAQCMEDYLLAHGVSGERLHQEDRSTSTRENLQFSDDLYHLKKKRTALISNNFHVYRSVLQAKSLGYEAMTGIPASSDLFMLPHNTMREICCLLRDYFLCNR